MPRCSRHPCAAITSFLALYASVAAVPNERPFDRAVDAKGEGTKGDNNNDYEMYFGRTEVRGQDWDFLVSLQPSHAS